ncbi:MAG TPA: NAD(P)-dependent oxidoreductase [Terriglobales bacterium]|nr:NAD(P)-dependent oxidoreductase [Terriglobales bacterium]
MRVLITGGAGNLGSRLARHLLETDHEVRLLIHKTEPPSDLAASPSVTVYRGDLANPSTLSCACAGADCIVHLAGVLFAPMPEEFLPRTNIGFVQNLLIAAKDSAIRKFILVSFPHVEGETTPGHPATDRLDSATNVVHFRTRLAAERLLLEQCEGTPIIAVILRAGVVYGRGIKLIEAARWLLRFRLLAIWQKPTWVHLIALPDFLAAVLTAIENENARGIYNVCDDKPLTIQEFLDQLAAQFGYRKPWRLPEWVFYAAGATCETAAKLFKTTAPLTRDIVRAGMTSAVADNSRIKRELLTRLAYPTLRQGIELLHMRR